MTTEFGPCEDWPVQWPCTISAESMALTGSAIAVATEIVWALSGRQFGLCRIKLRPCRRECSDAPWPNSQFAWPGTSWITPALIDGLWYNVTCGGTCSGDTCSCTAISEVQLPSPVNAIVTVKVDGFTIPASGYRVDNNRFLVRVDGGEWPHCNDLNLADTEEGTWSVTADYGRDVPEGGAWAVGELACELLKAFAGEDCRLPRNVTQLARQGVTISFPDMNDLFSRGKTGLYLTDLFISAWNPNGLSSRSRTYSIDRPNARRTDT